MARKRIKVEVLLSAIVVLFVAGIGGVGMRPERVADEVIPSRFGDVAWNHELHARLDGVSNCTVCHHKEALTNMAPRNCHDCHKPADNANALVLAGLHMDVEEVEYKDDHGPPPMTAMHSRCIGCHRAMEKGPLACRDCHAQRFSGEHGVVRWDHRKHARQLQMPTTDSLIHDEDADARDITDGCTYCHHQDEDASASASDDYRPCSACHLPADVMELDWVTEIDKHDGLRHGECKECHTTGNPEEDRRDCIDCHQGLAVDQDADQRPSLEAAIHDRCASCHNIDGAERDGAEPFRCTGCHRPDPAWLTVPEVGQVLWNHDRHGAFGEETTCLTCHHTDQPDEAHAACWRCHSSADIDNPSLREALEKRCLGCHEDEDNGLDSWKALGVEVDRDDDELAALERGPMSIDTPDGPLRWNHRGHAVDYSLSCRNCHHAVLRQDGAFVTPARAELSEWSEDAARIQACDHCHGQDGPVADSPADGSDAPSEPEMLKKICLSCHQELGGGPQTWDALFEVEPIERVRSGEDQ